MATRAFQLTRTSDASPPLEKMSSLAATAHSNAAAVIFLSDCFMDARQEMPSVRANLTWKQKESFFQYCFVCEVLSQELLLLNW